MYIEQDERKQEKKLLEKYKDEVVKFKDYWKYDFTYENERIIVVIGGDASEIYRAGLYAEQSVQSLSEQVDDDSFWIEEKPNKENQ